MGSRPHLMSLERIAELVGKRAELLRGRVIRALAVLTDFVSLAHLLNRRRTQTNAARGRVHVEDDDRQLVADAERFLDVAVAGNAALAQRNEAFDARLELDERAELRDARHAACA